MLLLGISVAVEMDVCKHMQDFMLFSISALVYAKILLIDTVQVSHYWLHFSFLLSMFIPVSQLDRNLTSDITNLFTDFVSPLRVANFAPL